MRPILFFVISLILLSCQKKCPEQGTIEDTDDIIQGVSIQIDTNIFKNEFIIRNNTENAVEAGIRFNGQQEFDTINFSKYSLLGKSVVFQSGGIIKSRKVSIDKEDKLVECEVVIESCGKTKETLAQMTWMLTKQIPEDYNVIFEVIEE